ncbi:hypothetical protein C8F04DRAFT_1191703 [Mycena alexandri]|uniref:Ribonuclease H1 N-terminal domain-containing protein n=1 Tax=Mycena alexandri TaxID=1745969 RepID=A0AAD6SCD8_9AGAR|nr:hypothetical protein C8F04DRAFT_1191703 [Mycena alexandri]
MSSPPSYQEAVDAVATSFAQLHVGRSPSATSPVSFSQLYQYTSPSRTGFTPDWHTAAAATQGVSRAQPQRLTPPHKSRKRGKKAAYVVFYGRRPGVYHTWAEARPLVNGVSGSVYQGYQTVAAASAAFAYAQARSWTRVCPPPYPALHPQSVHQMPIPRLPTPVADLDTPNALHGDADESGSRWLECSLNTVGLSCAVHDSFPSRAQATASFQSALARREVKVVYPAY